MEGMRKDMLYGDEMPSREIAPIIRNEDGTFAKGSVGQHALQTYEHSKWRNAMLARFRKCVTKQDFDKIVKKVVKEALNGSKWASLEIINRVMGPEKLNVQVSTENNVIWNFKYDLNDPDPQVKQVKSTIVDSTIIEQDNTNQETTDYTI